MADIQGLNPIPLLTSFGRTLNPDVKGVQAFVVITLLIWVAVSVSGTTTELSKTAGDTVNIPCHFGEGTVQNIFWYFKYCTGGHKILFYVSKKLTFGAEYANRTSLQKDNSTLILTDITVADEGSYCCDVDRQGQTAVTNIDTNLNVFSLRPDTLPKITPCSQVDESSSCTIHRKQSFTLACTLPNVYPVEDTELIWYQGGKRVLSTDNITQNDDGTTDISRQIQVSKTGNFTCNATYISANGRDNTARSVEAWITPGPTADVPNTPDKNLTNGPIIGIALSVAIVLIVGIPLCICCLKKRSHCCSKKDEQNSEVQPDPEGFKLLETQAKNVSKDENAESSEPTEQPTAAANRLKHEEVDNPNPPPPSTETQEENVNSLEQIVTEKQLRKLAGCLPAEYSKDVAINLGLSSIEHENTQLQNPSIKDATFKMLKIWEIKAGGGKMSDLDKALKEANCGGIKYKDV